jgi:hypothetical protein
VLNVGLYAYFYWSWHLFRNALIEKNIFRLAIASVHF